MTDALAGTTDALIVAPQVLIGERLVADAWVQVADGRVRRVGTGRPPVASTHVLPTGVLAPGLVDAQVNGAFGVDLVAADDAQWQQVRAQLATTGVTAFVPTFITAPVGDLAAALRRAARRSLAVPAASGSPVGSGAVAPSSAACGPVAGARVVGLHVEGPFLAARYRGAHDARHLADPTPAAIDTLLAAGGDALSYLTLAPERVGATAAIRQLTAAGVRVAIGHTDATEAQALDGVVAGATLVTHLFNAQRPFAHRDPGVVGVALTADELVCGLIVDQVHVAARAVRLAFAAAAGRIMLVTDAIAALGMPPGTYDLGGQPAEVRPGVPPVRPDGTLAGSTLRLDAAVGNAVACGVAPVDALLAATRVPADALGARELGRIEPGLPADLVWLDDTFTARATWIAGHLAHGSVVLSALATATSAHGEPAGRLSAR